MWRILTLPTTKKSNGKSDVCVCSRKERRQKKLNFECPSYTKIVFKEVSDSLLIENLKSPSNFISFAILRLILFVPRIFFSVHSSIELSEQKEKKKKNWNLMLLETLIIRRKGGLITDIEWDFLTQNFTFQYKSLNWDVPQKYYLRVWNYFSYWIIFSFDIFNAFNLSFFEKIKKRERGGNWVVDNRLRFKTRSSIRFKGAVTAKFEVFSSTQSKNKKKINEKIPLYGYSRTRPLNFITHFEAVV